MAYAEGGKIGPDLVSGLDIEAARRKESEESPCRRRRREVQGGACDEWYARARLPADRPSPDASGRLLVVSASERTGMPHGRADACCFWNVSTEDVGEVCG
jgi:hypothetical protein